MGGTQKHAVPRWLLPPMPQTVGVVGVTALIDEAPQCPPQDLAGHVREVSLLGMPDWWPNLDADPDVWACWVRWRSHWAVTAELGDQWWCEGFDAAGPEEVTARLRPWSLWDRAAAALWAQSAARLTSSTDVNEFLVRLTAADGRIRDLPAAVAGRMVEGSTVMVSPITGWGCVASPARHVWFDGDAVWIECGDGRQVRLPDGDALQLDNERWKVSAATWSASAALAGLLVVVVAAAKAATSVVVHPYPPQ